MVERTFGEANGMKNAAMHMKIAKTKVCVLGTFIAIKSPTIPSRIPISLAIKRPRFDFLKSLSNN